MTEVERVLAILEEAQRQLRTAPKPKPKPAPKLPEPERRVEHYDPPLVRRAGAGPGGRRRGGEDLLGMTPQMRAAAASCRRRAEAERAAKAELGVLERAVSDLRRKGVRVAEMPPLS